MLYRLGIGGRPQPLARSPGYFEISVRPWNLREVAFCLHLHAPESVASLGETTVWSLAAARTFTQPDDWWRRSIVNVSHMGPFSSERTTR